MLLFVLLLMMVFSHSQPESTQQVTLSCPAPSENNRGPVGAPGKRGARGQRGTVGLLRAVLLKK